jgi:hypothetical protein
MQQSHPYLLSNRSHIPANGVSESALKKKPIAALLAQTYGEASATTAENVAKFTPVKSIQDK